MKILIYTNILTPYRKYFYDLFYQECLRNGDDFRVLVMANTELGRSWTYTELCSEYTTLLTGHTFDKGEVHIHYNSDLGKQLWSFKPDVVVCAGSYLCPGTWTVTRLKRKLGYVCAYWSESHLNEERNYDSLKIKVREHLRNKFYKKYDAFWFSGTLSKEFILKYAKPDAKLFFLPNLIDEKKYSVAQENVDNKLRNKYNISASKTIFFCPARLVPVKGICEFLDLISKSECKETATIVIAGGGPLKEIINKKAIEYNVDIRLIGEKEQNEIINLYSIADIFLLPSLSDANPLTCVEALWAGLPLFISDHCGNYPEVIRQGQNGYVFSYEKSSKAIEMFDSLVKCSLNWKEEAKKISIEIANNLYCSEFVVKRLHSQLSEYVKA